MLKGSRENNLKIPKEIEIIANKPNTNDNLIETKKAYTTALNKKFNEDKEIAHNSEYVTKLLEVMD